jgi:DNA-binding transcriptional regulator YbjK
MSRRELVADAGVRLTARSGARALTHRAVDREAGLPLGSTSYYARTRRELTALVIARISAQLSEELTALRFPSVLDDADAAAIAAGFLEQLAARSDAQAARLVLLVELRDDEELRAPLTAADPVRARLVDTAQSLLSAIGAVAPENAAVDLVGVIDAVLLYRIAAVAPLDPVAILTAYIAGIPRLRHTPPSVL